MVVVGHERSQSFHETPVQMQQWSLSLNFTSWVGHLTIMEWISQNLSLPLTSSAGNPFSRMIDGHLSNPTETFGGIDCDLSYSIHERSPDFGRDFAAMPGRTWMVTLYALHEHCISILCVFGVGVCIFRFFFPCMWTVTSHGLLCRGQKLLFIYCSSLFSVLFMN